MIEKYKGLFHKGRLDNIEKIGSMLVIILKC